MISKDHFIKDNIKAKKASPIFKITGPKIAEHFKIEPTKKLDE